MGEKKWRRESNRGDEVIVSVKVSLISVRVSVTLARERDIAGGGGWRKENRGEGDRGGRGSVGGIKWTGGDCRCGGETVYFQVYLPLPKHASAALTWTGGGGAHSKCASPESRIRPTHSRFRTA